jgi:ParB family transcriptional regulator, chromosome partitioning protein
MTDNTISSPTHPTSALSAVPICNIAIPLRKRNIVQANIDCLVESISAIGLLNPIVVRRTSRPDIVTLVAGRHRLEAMKRLGRQEIECLVVSDGDLQAELMEIDENLCRAELSPAEEAIAITRRKEIYLALHPETAVGKSQAAAMNAKLRRGDVNDKMSLTFSKATAAASGKTHRSIERAAARGEAIEAGNLKKLAGTSLDKGAELDALAKMPMGVRQSLIERAAKGEIVTARPRRPPRRENARPDQKPVAPDLHADEEAQFDRLVAAWNAASEAVRGRFGVEVLHLGSGAWKLPSGPVRPNSPPTAT